MLNQSATEVRVHTNLDCIAEARKPDCKWTYDGLKQIPLVSLNLPFYNNKFSLL